MTWEFIEVAREGPLTILTLNRPELMNAMHAPANHEMERALDDFASDPDQWIAIITGAGDKAFCAGADLKHHAQGGDIRLPKTGFGGVTARFDLNKPLIAAVNGLAMGGGFEIALACDIVVASENATFALPEPRVGVAALAGGLLRLPRQIGMKHAMGMILTGRRVTAADGRSLGFVNEVAPRGEALSVARRWAQEILVCSPMSVRASKEAVLKGLDATLQAATDEQFRYPAMRALAKSEDMKEGPRAFAEKRPPKWQGK